MTDHELLHLLLGHSAPDPGCEACFAVMDEVAEALVAGVDIVRHFPEVAAHVRACARISTLHPTGRSRRSAGLRERTGHRIVGPRAYTMGCD